MPDAKEKPLALSPAPAGTKRDDVGPGRPPKEHQFKQGNPGRAKGSRNKLGEAFIQAMYSDFTEHGPKVIETVRTEKPDQYLKVVASILPQQLNVRVSEYDELTDDQIDQRINAIARALQLEAGTIAAAGREAAPQARKPLN